MRTNSTVSAACTLSPGMSLMYGTPELASGEGSEIVPHSPSRYSHPDDTLGSNGELEEDFT